MNLDSSVADKLENKLRGIFKPDDGGDIIEWLENNISQIPYSPMPSGFRVSHTPWLAEPLRACADLEKKNVHIIAPIQSGKSLGAEMLSCYIIARQPAPTLYLNDTDDNASNWMRTRLRILWENVPAVMKKLPKGEEKAKGDTVIMPDMTFWCCGAFNRKNLQQKSIRWLIADETWLYPKGHLKEAIARVESFGWLGKTVFMSQGGFQGDETEEFWNMTTKSVWSFACPKCGHKQPFKWEQIRIPDDIILRDGDYDYNKVRKETVYECEGCAHHFKDSIESRMEMNKTGFYATTNPNADLSSVGFTWNCLCARSWGKSAEAYLRAKNIMDSSGDSGPLRIFKQKQLALFWSDAPDKVDMLQTIGEYNQGDDWEGEFVINPLNKRIHNDRTAKDHIKCRFMTVDVQRNGFYCLVRSWAEGGVSRLFRLRFVQTWNDVDAFAKANGVFKSLVYVDCGDQMDDVIRQCGINGWTALRGDQRNEFPWKIQTSSGIKIINKPYAPARLVNVGTGVVRVHHFSNLALKDQLSRLRKSGKHTCPADAGGDYFEQMESEARVLNPNGKPEWKRIGKRDNHFWDCEVMQLIPANAFALLGSIKEQHIISDDGKSVEDPNDKNDKPVS